ncbi:Prephenate dehydrogenase [Methanocaldococcus infernus ME]|uniref:Prephenate dehydrogenase n=1 Tax=Methanocaldococcus infernus (strain DSM 11812 / JCM 15783 / ME) TaxID=573063 RepID=D5VQL4_METIM|nr:prephenate dehydrogenase [Methanocaldococcus infernus]ADG12867.1 Prephenate dehydrogenase [Methanocaldococcus infernus ME]
MKISIIGGTDGLGKWLAKFLKSRGFEVIVTGRDIKKGKEVEKELGVRFLNNNVEAAKLGDIVIISVPINVTERVIKEVAPHVREGSLLMDVTSIKEIPSKAMEKYAKEGVTVIPSHPMFGPTAPSLERQVVILTPSEKHKKSEWFNKVYNFLKKEGARVYILKPEVHDKIMAVVQGLTHYSIISLASTLKELNVDIKESRKFASPVYELILSLIGRIIGQNPYLYADIQMFNPRIEKIHKTFINECIKIHELVKSKDREGFVKLMKEAAKHFGNEAKRGAYYSDKAIFALTREIEELKKNIGKEIAVKNLDSENIHIGTLKEVEDDYLTLKKNGKEVKLNILRTEVYYNVDEIKKKLFERKYFDISVLFNKDVNEKIIEELLKKLFDLEIIDIYELNDKKSVTFRLYGYSKEELREKERKFKEIIKNIGGSLRYEDRS